MRTTLGMTLAFSSFVQRRRCAEDAIFRLGGSPHAQGTKSAHAQGTRKY